MRTVNSGISLTVGLVLTDLDAMDLWGLYLALGGQNSYPELTAYLAGAAQWSAHEHDVAAHALNEYFDERGMDHPVQYADDLLLLLTTHHDLGAPRGTGHEDLSAAVAVGSRFSLSAARQRPGYRTYPSR
jgi:hypothetical protein